MYIVKLVGVVIDKYKVKVSRCGNSFKYLNGRLHSRSSDVPAVEYLNSYRAWWLNGKRHREGGPAVIYSDGAESWWIFGLPVSGCSSN